MEWNGKTYRLAGVAAVIIITAVILTIRSSLNARKAQAKEALAKEALAKEAEAAAKAKAEAEANAKAKADKANKRDTWLLTSIAVGIALLIILAISAYRMLMLAQQARRKETHRKQTVERGIATNFHGGSIEDGKRDANAAAADRVKHPSIYANDGPYFDPPLLHEPAATLSRLDALSPAVHRPDHPALFGRDDPVDRADVDSHPSFDSSIPWY